METQPRKLVSFSSEIPTVQKVAAILWPSFLLAAVATGVFFTVFDAPVALNCQGESRLSYIAAYSLGFFLFWLLGAGSSAATAYFLRPTVDGYSSESQVKGSVEDGP